ncbi:unnamed protein product [Hymenolepis diminuta]|uniref:isopentenyl-diphosphate Delta-isomerase n=2 Tax=Hymenolepis diminuta TaxID=6216 RepID=A0A564YCY2_HYMDI|nr:unnamed protein product [Hymenolepis diminuta]
MSGLVSSLRKFFLHMPETFQKSTNLRSLSALAQSSCQFQYDLMKQDNCIVVDNYDNALSVATKEECHFKEGLLHRAFSLFIFRQVPNSEDLELLMQRRSPSKLTFPLLWTNTCCSHPCTNYVGETEERNAVGVRRAAQRKVEHELGIDSSRQLLLENIHFLTRIKYSAHNEPVENDWCEREVDYLLVSIVPAYVKTDSSTFLKINSNEVAESEWTKEHSINTAFSNDPYIYTPWFRKVVRMGLLHRMFNWAAAKVTNNVAFPSLDKIFDRSSILEFD